MVADAGQRQRSKSRRELRRRGRHGEQQFVIFAAVQGLFRVAPGKLGGGSMAASRPEARARRCKSMRQSVAEIHGGGGAQAVRAGRRRGAARLRAQVASPCRAVSFCRPRAEPPRRAGNVDGVAGARAIAAQGACRRGTAPQTTISQAVCAARARSPPASGASRGARPDAAVRRRSGRSSAGRSWQPAASESRQKRGTPPMAAISLRPRARALWPRLRAGASSGGNARLRAADRW